MAPVNPPVQPTQEPHYWHWSKPIEQPKFEAPTAPAFADVSKGELIKGIGDIGEAAVQGADAIVKKFAGEKTEDFVRQQRDIRTAELEAAEKTTGGQQQSLLSDKPPGQTVPQSLDKAIDKLSVFEGARARGTISETGYYRRINQGLSDIRSQYPVGYRDYIDQKASHILGTDPANAQIRSMVADINSYITAKNAEQNKVMSLIENQAKEGNPEVGSWLKLYQAGKLDLPGLAGRVAQSNQRFWDEKVSKADLGKYKADTELQSMKAGEVFTKSTENMVIAYQQMHQTEAGVTDQNAANVKLDDKSAEVKLQQYVQEKALATARINEMADVPIPEAGGKTYRQLVGTDQINKIAASSTAVWDGKIDRITNKDYGELHQFERHSEFLQSQAGAAMTDDPVWGSRVNNLLWIRKNFGDVDFNTAIGLPNQPGGGRTELIDNLVRTDKTRRLYQNGQTPENPYTIDESFKKLKQNKVDDPVVYRGVLQSIVGKGAQGGVLDPKTSTPAVQAQLNALFDPANAGFIGTLSKDSQMDAFAQMTDPSITDVVTTRGSKKNNTDYKNWMEGSFRGLYRQRLQDLNGLSTIPGMSFRWDDQNQQIIFDAPKDKSVEVSNITKRGLYQPSYQDQESKIVQSTIDEINLGLAGISHYAKSTKKLDANAFVLGEMIDMGFNPDIVKNIPSQIMKAVMSSRGQTQEEKEAEAEAIKKLGKKK